MEVAWYMDAWAVRDGAAFASKRHPESIDASTCVFLCVPDLEPVAVGRISTALSATRRNFQDGFRDSEGDEIAFDSLAQIREVVRRGFLGGGIGPDGVATPFPPGPPPDEPGFPGVDGESSHFFDSQIPFMADLELDWVADKQDVEAIAQRLPELVEDDGLFDALIFLTGEFAKAVAHTWQTRINLNPHPAEEALLQQWIFSVLETELWQDLEWLDTLLNPQQWMLFRGVTNVARLTGLQEYNWSSVFAAVRQNSRHDLIAAAPCARRAVWHPRILRLVDKAFLPMTVSDYFLTNRFLPELAPSFLVALVLTASMSNDSQISHFSNMRSRCHRALRWLADQLPREPLPTAADEAINRYAWRQIDRG